MRGNGLDTSPVRWRARPGLNGAASLAGHQDRAASPLDPPGRSAVEREEASRAISLARFVLLVLLPFVGGYYLSYLYRSINALISEALVSEFGLSPGNLGFLTATYFLAFGVIQLPLGVWLDRFGPRRVQAVLLSIAAVGAALFASADGFLALSVGRGLIGLGVAGALMAGLKAIVLWFPPERIALANGWFIMLGALGAVTATAPAEIVLAHMGWRGVFAVLAVVTAVSALVILVVVPEHRHGATPGTSANAPSIVTIYRDPRFWRLAPLSATCIGSAWALQGLWAAPWLTDVEELERAVVVTHLFVMALALSASALLLGIGADRLRRRGTPLATTLAVATGAAILAQLALVLRWPVPGLAAVGHHRRHGRRHRAELRDPQRNVPELGLWSRQWRPQPAARDRGVRDPIRHRSRRSAVACRTRALPARGLPDSTRPQPASPGRCVSLVHPPGTQNRSPASPRAPDPRPGHRPRARPSGGPVLRPRPACMVLAIDPRLRAATGLALGRLRFLRRIDPARRIAHLERPRPLRYGPCDRERARRRYARLRG